jgi:hypothetical protein
MHVHIVGTNSTRGFVFFLISDLTYTKSHDTLTYQKYKKKSKKKRYYRLCSNCAPFCAKHWRHLCAVPYVIFVICFPANLIRLLHCKAMYFDSFSLGARHLFQKVVLFFYLFSYLRH